MAAPRESHSTPLRVVRVMPDAVGLHKRFDYLVPQGVSDELIRVGSVVRINLAHRSVRGWIVACDVQPPDGVQPVALKAVQGFGPGPELVALAEWAATRWVGHPVHFLRAATPPTIVSAIPPPARDPIPKLVVPGAPGDGLVPDAIAGGSTVVRLPPGVDRFGFVATALTATLGRAQRADDDTPTAPSALVVCPSTTAARQLSQRLRRAGFPVATVCDDGQKGAVSRQWALAASGGHVVVGARSAAWAPAPNLALGIVVDEHDEAHQSERTPTWHARDVVLRRCADAGAPAVMLSPCPTQESLQQGRLLTMSRRDEREGWPTVVVFDRRNEDPATRSGLFPPRLAETLRGTDRVICVVNRKGRVRMLACRACESLVACDVCGAAMASDEDGTLRCSRCDHRRPMVCAACGGHALRVVRTGVSRARDDLAAVLGEPVMEVTGSPDLTDAAQRELERARVLIGTEAVLHRVGQASVVAFVDFDAELTAPRFRAGEQALALLTRAAKLAGPRNRGHRVIVQTRMPDNPVIAAAVHANPGLYVDAEAPVRALLELPPTTALAHVSGAGAGAYIAALRAGSVFSASQGLRVRGDEKSGWLVQAVDHATLSAVLGGIPRPVERVRISIDPLNV